MHVDLFLVGVAVVWLILIVFTIYLHTTIFFRFSTEQSHYLKYGVDFWAKWFAPICSIMLLAVMTGNLILAENYIPKLFRLSPEFASQKIVLCLLPMLLLFTRFAFYAGAILVLFFFWTSLVMPNNSALQLITALCVALMFSADKLPWNDDFSNYLFMETIRSKLSLLFSISSFVFFMVSAYQAENLADQLGILFSSKISKYQLGFLYSVLTVFSFLAICRIKRTFFLSLCLLPTTLTLSMFIPHHFILVTSYFSLIFTLIIFASDRRRKVRYENFANFWSRAPQKNTDEYSDPLTVS